MSREGFLNNGLTTSDLNTQLSLLTEVKDGRRPSISLASNDDGRGSSSHVLIAVLFNTSRTVDFDTGWKAIGGDPSKPVWVTGGRGMFWELRWSRMVEMLFTKKSQKLCGRSAEKTEDGRDEIIDLPGSVFCFIGGRCHK